MRQTENTAIVLRYANYRDYDRMLTLLSPTRGKLEVLSRGCRRPKSPLLNASELFALGDFQLYTKQERATLVSANLLETFYPLRGVFDRLSVGVYLLNLAEAAAQPGEPCQELFMLLLHTLSRLTFSDQEWKPLLAGFYEDFEQAGFQVTVELMESPPAVSADPGAVTRILTNLIGNALKHGSKTLDIRLYQEGQTLVTAFSNDAPELTQEDLPRVFERFYTADQMRTGQNTGLGLAIVKALSEQMGHTAFADLKDGVFTVGVRWKL